MHIKRFLQMIGIVTLSMSTALSAANPPGSPAEVADELYRALKAGQAESVRSMLSENVKVFEGGKLEDSLAAYAAHHLGADMAFLKDMQRAVLEREEILSTEVATVTSMYQLSGTYQNQQMGVKMTETLVMKRTETGWQIHVIHWSAQ